MRQIIRDNLDNALLNADPEFWKETPLQIALDMCDYASDCEGMVPDAMVPHIVEWMGEQGLTCA